MGIAVINGILVLDRAARLNDRFDSCMICYLPQSGKGKNASLAMTDPSVSKPKCLGFGNGLVPGHQPGWSVRFPCLSAVCSLQSAIPFDLRCFTTSSANNRSSVCAASGLASVTSSSADDAVRWLFLSMASTPCSRLRNCSAGKSNLFCSRMIRFFYRPGWSAHLQHTIMMTSKNNSWIMAAVAASTSLLAISTPPNADTGSAASAFCHASDNIGQRYLQALYV